MICVCKAYCVCSITENLCTHTQVRRKEDGRVDRDDEDVYVKLIVYVQSLIIYTHAHTHVKRKEDGRDDRDDEDVYV